MSWFTDKKHDRPVKPVLVSAWLDQRELFSLRADELPFERRRDLELSHAGQQLRFIDSTGAVRAYDLSSIFDDGERIVHLSVQVNPNFTVQMDAVLTKDGLDADQAFRRPGGKGVRFEPFYLPECDSDPAELIGRGLIYRGLHFPGTITPTNVSLLCICDSCRQTFRLSCSHAGFSGRVYLYCSRESHMLSVSQYVADAPPLLAPADPDAVARFESRLPACSGCGSEFRYMNPLRCPHCREPYVDFQRHPEERDREYYAHYLYGSQPQRWEPQ